MARPDIAFLAGQHLRNCRHQVDKRFSGYQTLQYMAGGAVELWIDQKRYALNGRWFWSAYPGPRIRFNALAPARSWEHRYVAFRGPLVARWMEDGLFPIAPQQPPERGATGRADIEKRFDRVLRLAREPARWSAVRASHELEAILIELAAAREQAPDPPAWVGQATQRLTSAHQTMDYESLAEQLGMSQRTLRRNFRQRLGLSPHQFVIAHRVQAARDLLVRSDTTIKEIAARLGYADVFYFGRQFKKVTGVSPAVFRRSREG